MENDFGRFAVLILFVPSLLFLYFLVAPKHLQKMWTKRDIAILLIIFSVLATLLTIVTFK